jgi:hypothetical protein
MVSPSRGEDWQKEKASTVKSRGLGTSGLPSFNGWSRGVKHLAGISMTTLMPLLRCYLILVVFLNKATRI